MNPNLKAIKEHYAGSDAKDLDAMMAPVTGETEWTEMAGFPYAGTYVGPDQIVAGVFVQIDRDWRDYRFELERLVDGGDVIVGIGTYSGVCRSSGKDVRARVTHVWTMRDARVVRFEQFTDTKLFAEAMQNAGP